MHFKRLEMQGFKSFVDSTALDFEAGITAIIGPNGCGKSNIVDSIRWVLGEQSAKSLRGTRMEDVIFNGTDQRKAVGMAEVSLIIDNHDKQLKSAHEEITITRRNFRSGESEYLINKAPCRLRDIHDLFMDTGIGTNSYSILEQGKIDLIISTKPADRRFVFEEAAGISKYKARKDESLRKLEAAEQNYLRVNDIAVEVRRQINSLERQVQKARRYQALKQELTTLEVTQGRRDLKERRRHLRKIEQEWEARQACIEENEADRRSYEQNLLALAQELETAEAGLAQAKDEVHALHEEIITAENFISSSELRKNDLLISLARLDTELAALDNKESQLRQQNAGALEACGQKERELENCRQALLQEEERLNALERGLKEKAAFIQDQQNRLLELVDQMSTLRGTLKNLEIRRGEQEQRRAKLELQLENLLDQSREVQQEKDGLEHENRFIADSLHTLRAEQTQLGTEKERLEQVLKTLNSMLESFNKTITQLTSRLTWIEELKNGLDGYELGAKTVLLAHNAQPERFPGLVGPLANFIRTEQKYEFAFEAMLGHRLQYILVQTQEDALQAMAFLQEGNRGRATFIPLDCFAGPEAEMPGVENPTTASWLYAPGTCGWAKDLVRVDERFRGIIDRLLAPVAIVQDLAALEQARRAGARCTLVTLQGEIQTAEHWLTGGSQDIMEKGLLGREREIEELKAECGILEKNLAQTQQEQADTIRRLESTSGGLETVNAQLHELDIKAAQTEKSLERVHAQHDEMQRQTAAAQGEHAQVQDMLRLALAEYDRTVQQLRDLELTDRRTQEELTNHQSDIEAMRGEYDERSLRAGELRVHSASLEQQLSGLSAEAGRVMSEIQELAAQKAEKIATGKRDQERLADLDYQVKEKQSLQERLHGQKQNQEGQVANLRQQREELITRKQAQDKTLRQMQQRLDDNKLELHQLELEKTKVRMNLKSLESYLVEEYKLDLTMEKDEEPAAEEGIEAEAAAAPEETEAKIKALKDKINSMGSVNLVAMEEYDELEQRHAFLSQQLGDLRDAKENLQRLIIKINHESRERFAATFVQVREKFKEVFRRLFKGGEADLILVDETNLLETGIEIIARPPGKRLQNISLLSGGEKALTAIALLFAIFLIKPSPFCIFDEMDAPLDDTNTLRFGRILREFAQRSQFIIITHNKITMETADVLYGVTMQESGVSSLISVKFKDQGKEKSIQPVTAMTEEVSLN
ncbi:chromosome segregation protein SMC [candidate division FCPU426 bacterium]|nr:chromosome segregation protein SMC [candidate division FCPU426 bacterium]